MNNGLPHTEYELTDHDYHVNWAGCFAMDGSKVAQIKDFEDGSVYGQYLDEKGRSVGSFHFERDKLDYFTMPERGYFNTVNGAVYAARILKKQWRRGIASNNLMLKDVSHMARNKCKGKHKVSSSLSAVAKQLMLEERNLKHFNEALTLIKSGDQLSVAIDRLAVLSLNHDFELTIEYDGPVVVGYVNKQGTPVVQATHPISKILDKQGVHYETL